jgi:uncharacterized protein YjeT (DUF2065 family)
MSGEIITAIGLVFVIEGLIWALFPQLFRRLALMASDTPEGQLRLNGIIAIAVGVFIVWLVRG